MVNSQAINNSVPFVDSAENRKMNFLEYFVILFYAAYYLLPAVSARVTYMIPLFLGLAYLAFLFLYEPNWRMPIIVFLFTVVMISFLFFTLTETSTISTSVSNYTLKRITSKMYQFFMMFFPAYMFARVYTTASQKQKRFFFTVIFIMFAIVVVNTFIELMTNNSASKNWSEFAEQNENNVGTYSFVYAVPMVITALVSLLYSMRGAGKRLVVLGIIAFMLAFLLSAQYTLALLIAIIGIALQISTNIKSIAVKLLLWLVFIGALFLLPTVLDLLANTIKSQQIATRFKELASFFGSGDASGYNLNGRLELYGKSIEAFIKSPILGNRKLNFDGHATLLTVPADIGISGLIGLVVLFKSAKKYVSLAMGNKAKKFVPTFLCLLIMGFTNPIHAASTALYGTWMMAPIIVMLGDKE